MNTMKNLSGVILESNTTVKPPRPAPVLPRVLGPLEMEQLKAAVGEEQVRVLEAKATAIVAEAPLFNGTLKRALVVGGIAAGGVAVGVGSTLLIQKIRARRAAAAAAGTDMFPMPGETGR